MANTTGKKFGGRIKGVPNKRTAESLSRAENVLQIIEEKYFEKDIKALTSSQRMMLYSDMLEYVAPKLSRTDINGSLDNKITLHIVRSTTTGTENPTREPAESL